jgi:hypothetical protein
MFNRSIVLLLLLLINFYQAARAEGLQRLFTTPQERAALNAERSKPPPPLPIPPTAKRSKPPPTTSEQKHPSTPKSPSYITFNGLIIRSDGQPTVWINGSNDLFQQGFTVELEKIADDLSVPIVLSNSKQRIFLKPGQTVNTLDGTIQEHFEKP